MQDRLHIRHGFIPQRNLPHFVGNCGKQAFRMSETPMKPEVPPAENTHFFRRYDVRLENDILVTEFDYGFLSSSRIVYHAHNHAAFELIAVSKGVSMIDTMDRMYSCHEGSVLLLPQGCITVIDRQRSLPNVFVSGFIRKPFLCAGGSIRLENSCQI